MNYIFQKGFKWGLIAISLIYLTVSCYLVTGYFSEGLRGFVLGDLLINYNCGFVRRGLAGTILTSSSNFFNIDILPLVNLSVFFAYLMLVIFLLYKLWDKSFILFFACCSPFGLLFLGNNWDGVGRKEIFLLCIFVTSLFSIKIFSGIYRNIVISILILAGILIHEMYLLLSLPWVVWAYSIKVAEVKTSKLDLPKILKWLPIGYGFYILAAALFAISVYIFSKHKAEKTECLQELFAKYAIDNPNIVPKLSTANLAVQWLEKDLAFAVNETSNIYKTSEPRNYWWPRLLLFTGTIITVFYYIFSKAISNPFKTKGVHILAITLGLIIQLWAALDWGRFLHTFYMHAIIMAAWLPFKIQFGQKSKFGIFEGVVVYFFMASTFVMIPHIYIGGEQRTFFMQAQGNQILLFLQRLIN